MIQPKYCVSCKESFIVVVNEDEVALCPKCGTPLQDKEDG